MSNPALLKLKRLSTPLTIVLALMGGLAHTGAAIAQETYEIESVANDEVFAIAGARFTAQGYCFDFEPGDEIEWLSDEPIYSCSNAKFRNLRNSNTCEVWCD